jgi:hypothetical protein
MFRRALTLICALAVVLGGSQPSLGMTLAAPVEATMSLSDCPERDRDSCCDKTDSERRICLWSDACAVRCHVNAGLEAVSFEPVTRIRISVTVALPEPRPLHTARAGPHFRPPILSISF